MPCQIFIPAQYLLISRQSVSNLPNSFNLTEEKP